MLKKTFKDNTGAIITALIVLLLIANYIFRIIPANQEKQDEYNKSRLDQFAEQLSFTLKDYVNAIEIKDIKNAMRPVLIDFLMEDTADVKCPCKTDPIVRNAALQFKKAFYDSGFKKNISLGKSGFCAEDSLFIDFAQGLKKTFNETELNSFRLKNRNTGRDSIYADGAIFSDDAKYDGRLLETIVVEKITIQSLRNQEDDLILKGKIYLNFDTTKNKISEAFINKFKELSFTKTIPKQALKARLSGSALFDNWIIYNIKENENKMEVLVNKGIDFQERDSLMHTSSKLGVITYPFSDKRFYKLSFNLEGTNHYILLAGAVNQANFESEIHATDVSSTIAAIIAIALIFLCIPLIKPLISSAKENLTQRDLLSTTSALGIFAVILACFIFTSLLSRIQKNSIHQKLKQTNNRISEHYTRELKKYQSYLPAITPILFETGNRLIHKKLSGKRVTFDTAIQNFFLMSPSGEIVKDITDDDFKIRKNYSDRDYFKLLSDPVKNYHSVFTSVYSKNDNVYKFVFAVSHHDSVVGFAYRPKLTADTVDFDEGYLVCKKDGQVINHSDRSRNLNENFYRDFENEPEVQKLFHGFGDTTNFSLEYDGQQCLFFGKEVRYDTANAYPLYILTYKKMGFENNLKIYSLVNGFIFSSSYALCLIILAFLYSSIFYSGNIRVFSRYHFYWLFPDNSRKREYKVLTVINLLMVALFIICIFTFVTNIFYNSIIAGFSLIFVNFVFLNQREFLPVHIFNPLIDWLDRTLRLDLTDVESTEQKPGPSSIETTAEVSKRMLVFSLVALLPFVASLLFGAFGNYGCGVFTMISIHFVYLYTLGKNCGKEVLTLDVINKSFKKKIFTTYMASNVLFHYWIIPCIVVYCLFSSEDNKYVNFHRNSANIANIGKATPVKPGEASLKDIFYDLRGGVNPPSWKPLRESKLDHYSSDKQCIKTLSHFISPSEHLCSFILVLLGAIIATLALQFILISLIRFYTARFFFIDLSVCYQDKKLVIQENEFLNTKVILPPYNETDLLILENNEKPGADRKSRLYRI